jgi:UDP-N-acetylmuramoylalanine--D-glutamate ligase
MLNLENTFANPTMLGDAGYQAPYRFLIMGLGESGVAMTKWCLLNGAVVRLIDTRDQSQFSERQNAWLDELKIAGLKDIQFGPLSDALLTEIDVIGISPGLSPLQEPTKSFLEKARKSQD